METEAGGDGVQSLGFAIPFHLPVAVPDTLLRERCARDAGPFAIGALIVPEVFAIDIGERGMGQIQILHGPYRLVVAAPILALAEENELEAEPFTMRIRHITRVIPPLGAEVLMFKVIAGKLVTIAGDGLAPGWSAGRESGGQ